MMASFGPSAWPPLVATSSEETLLLTRTGEVLVCRHAADNQNDIDDNEDGVAPYNIDISKTTSSEFLDDCSLNANSFEASITGRNKLHRQQQRQSLQKAWAECCEPERFCDLSNQDNKHVNHLNSSGRGGGLFGGSEEGLLDTANSNYTELVNGMGSKLKINQDGHQKGTDNDWNTVTPPKRKKKLQQSTKQQQSTKLKQLQQPLLRTPPRNTRKTDNSLSSTINNFGSNDDSDDDEEEAHDEKPDRVNINDVQLQDHNNFIFIGGSGGSPTPMLSFDYTNYEPPTPERLLDNMHDDDGSCTSTEVTFSMSGPLPPPLPPASASTKAGEDGGNGTMTINGHHHKEQNLNEKQQQQKQPRRRRSRTGNASSVLSGIPTFLHHLSQIRITHLSAHPRGRHVLLISEEGLLFSYGSNECGQLGLGRFHKNGDKRGSNTNNEVDSTRFSVTIPSIVTPLLENGGKTVNCAAGVDYSLVVVRTEGSRLAHRRYNKVSPSPASGNNSLNDCITHHQMYGFGNNEHMKLGLLDPDGNGKRRNNNASGNFTTPRRNRGGNADLDSAGSGVLSCVSSCVSTPDSLATVESGIEENDHKQASYVFLPRRVALHCRVISRKGTHPAMKQPQTDLPPLEYGIFKVAASSDHSTALVRRPSGAVELYSWGRGEALGQPVSHAAQEADIPSPRRWECVPLPSIVPQKNETQSLTIATPTLVTSLSLLHENQPSVKSGAPPRTPSPRKESRQRTPGKTQSNSDNLEGTKSLLNPTEYLVDVALGPSCTHAVSSLGRWFAFGSSQDRLLGLGANTTTTNVPTEVKLAGSETIQSVSIGEKHAVAVSNEGVAYTWGKCKHGIRTRADSAEPVSSPQPISFADTMLNKRKTLEDALVRHMGMGASANNASDDADGVVYAHAGRDLSVFVLESGSVLTCGQKSGRLGQGNVSMNVNSPRQMFGGLHLWRND
mmetsp:Transcript_28968/g.58173  ORF Transcript_28968/g.58173 Transcript_28968/m.58173 type:complete len:952 (+) Transcript_28968:101-2956(+)